MLLRCLYNQIHSLVAERNAMKRILIMTFKLMIILAVSVAAQAQSDPKQEKSAAEIAAELANPNTALGTLTFNLDYVANTGDLPGADEQNAVRLTFQPSLPVPLGKGLNFFARPAVPLVFYQDVPAEGGGFENTGFNLGDIGFDAALGKSFQGGLIVIGGLVGTLPTATDDSLAGKQLRFGPEAAAAVAKKWGVLGVLITHQWDVATVGDRADYDTSVTGGQYFYTFNVKKGWQIGASPTFAYNHEAAEGQEWTFPIGFGVKKTSILGGTPWKFGLEYWYYAVQPDTYGPSWQLRFSVGPVVPLPW